jgi:hypothetical protein
MKIIGLLLLVFLFTVSGFPLYAQPFTPDTHTLLLLHLDNNTTGAQGESPTQSTGISYKGGIFSQGAYLPTGSNLDYNSSGNINPQNGTLEFWIKPRWNGNDNLPHTILQFGGYGGIKIQKDGGNYWKSIFNLYGGDGMPEMGVGCDISSLFLANQWHHCAFTWSASSLKLYIDGIIRGTQTIPNPLPSIADLTFQIGGAGTNEILDAVVDELRISDYERSPSEIAASFSAGGIIVTSITIKLNSLHLYPSWTWIPEIVATTNINVITLSPSAVQWTSSNPAVASADTNGLITALSTGNATLTANYNGIQGTINITVMTVTRPPEYGTINTMLTTPAAHSIDTIPVIIIRYLPTTDGTNLDISFDPDPGSLAPMSLDDLKSNINTFDKRVKFMLEEGSKFRGYKDPTAVPSIGYKVVSYITVYEPTPPGLIMNYTKNVPVYLANFKQIFARFNIENYVNNLGVKEIWFWTSGVDPSYISYDSTIHRPENIRGLVESNMSSPLTGDVSNSSQNPDDLPIYQKTYIVYMQNFRRTQAEAVHDRGHQYEVMFSYINMRQDGNTDLFWNKFVGRISPGNFSTGRCGWTHMPPNTTVDYDYTNPTLVWSDIEDWYPDGHGQKKQVNEFTWGNLPYQWPDNQLPEQQIESQWYIYWMQNMPGLGNTITYGINNMTNWWKFISNWDNAQNIGLYNATTPVELTSFISFVTGRQVNLSWETKTEINSNQFEIERALVNTKDASVTWTTVGTVQASGSSFSPKKYSFSEKNLQAGRYQFKLKMIDIHGSLEYSKIIETEVAIPKNFELSQNYPNPFNPSTKIDYQLPIDSKVVMEVYNIAGQKIFELVNQEQSAGYYTIDFGSSKLPSGVYIYRIAAGDKAAGNNFSSIKKMMLLK